MRVLVDTDVVSYGLRADPRFDQFYGPTLASAEPFVAFMTIGELEHGAALRNWAEIRATTILQRSWKLYSETKALFLESSKKPVPSTEA